MAGPSPKKGALLRRGAERAQSYGGTAERAQFYARAAERPQFYGGIAEGTSPMGRGSEDAQM